MPQQSNQNESSHIARKTFIAYLVIVASSALVYFLYLIGPIVLQVLVATILALALSPAVRLLERRGFNHTWATVTAVLTTLAVFLVAAAAILTPLVSEGVKLAQNAPHIINDVTNNPQLRSLNQEYHVIDRIKQLAQQAPAYLSGAQSPVLGALGSALGVVSSITIIIVLTFFILKEGPRAWRNFLKLLQPSTAGRVDRTGQRVAAAVSGFVSGNLFIGALAGTFTLIVLLLTGVPYPFALAGMVALLSLIPIVGAVAGTVIVGLVALTQSVGTALLVVGLMLLYQFIDGQVTQPMVYSRTVSLSPLLILLASIIGAQLGGVVGLLIAIPLAAALQIVAVEVISGTASGRRANLKQS